MDVYVYCAKSAKTDTAIRRIEDTPEESFTAHNTEHPILSHEFESMVLSFLFLSLIIRCNHSRNSHRI